MPAKQCRGREHERPPAVPRQTPTRRREEEPIDCCYSRTLVPSTENSELVAQDDDFKLFEVVRAEAQSRRLENPGAPSSRTKPARDLLRGLILRTRFWFSRVERNENPIRHPSRPESPSLPGKLHRNSQDRHGHRPRLGVPVGIVGVLNETCVHPVKSGIMSSMKIVRNIIIVVALSAVALATSACPEKGPAEKAGEKIDKAIDKTTDAAKDATK